MVSHIDNCREKIELAYVLAGITADLAQLERAHLRVDRKGMKRNVTQIIRKLEKVHKLV